MISRMTLYMSDILIGINNIINIRYETKGLRITINNNFMGKCYDEGSSGKLYTSVYCNYYCDATLNCLFTRYNLLCNT